MGSVIADIALRLQESLVQLNQRGLFHASVWCSEQLLGITRYEGKEVDIGDHEPDIQSTSADSDTVLSSEERRLIAFATSLLSLADYARCALLFRKNSKLRRNLSSTSIFIACYSLYLAGEKLKDQLDSEAVHTPNSLSAPEEQAQPRKLPSKGSPSNPYLQDLFIELLPYYETPAEATADGYLLYLFALIVRDIRSSQSPLSSSLSQKIHTLLSTEEIFLQAVLETPYNWSAWLDLSSYCSENQLPLPPLLIHLLSSKSSVSSSSSSPSCIFESSSSARIMFQCFLVHHFLALFKPQQCLPV